VYFLPVCLTHLCVCPCSVGVLPLNANHSIPSQGARRLKPAVVQIPSFLGTGLLPTVCSYTKSTEAHMQKELILCLCPCSIGVLPLKNVRVEPGSRVRKFRPCLVQVYCLPLYLELTLIPSLPGIKPFSSVCMSFLRRCLASRCLPSSTVPRSATVQSGSRVNTFSFCRIQVYCLPCNLTLHMCIFLFRRCLAS